MLMERSVKTVFTLEVAGKTYAVKEMTMVEGLSMPYRLDLTAELEASRFEDAGDSSDLAFGITYILNPQWRFSLGYMITNIEGMDPEDISAESPELDANTIGLGAVYSPSDRWQVTFGITDVTYDSVTTTSAIGTVEYKKHVNAGSAGIQYRF